MHTFFEKRLWALACLCCLLLSAVGTAWAEDEIFDYGTPFYAKTTEEILEEGSTAGLYSPDPNNSMMQNYMFMNEPATPDYYDAELLYAFKSCTSMEIQSVEDVTSIRVPWHIESFGIGTAFELTELDLSGAKNLKELSLMNVPKLKTLNVPYGVELVSLNHVTGLTSLTLPSTVKVLDIWHCEELTQLNIPEGVEYLSVRNCYELTSLTVPKSVKKLYRKAFDSCTKLSTLRLLGDPEVDFMGGTPVSSTAVKTVYLPDVNSANAAKWKKVVTVKSLSNLYDVTYDFQTGETIETRGIAGKTLQKPAETYREGYRLTGWYRDAALTQQWNFASNTMPSSSLTLYAGWEKLNKVTYRMYPGMRMPDEWVSTGEKAPLPLQQPFRDGYLFTGWYEDSDCTIPWLFDENTITQDTTLYAGWKYVLPGTVTVENGQVVLGEISVGQKKLVIPDVINGQTITALGPNCIPAGVEEVTLPAGVAAIDPAAFSRASDLHTIIVPEESQYFYTENGVLYSAANHLICYPRARKDVEFTVKSGTASIRANAIAGARSLRTINVPSSVKEVKPGAVVDCTNLTCIRFAAEITLIDPSFIQNCGMASMAGPANATMLSLVAELNGMLYNQYAVMFHSGTKRLGRVVVAEGELVTDVPELPESDKTFAGWALGSEDGEMWNLATDTMPNASIALYAVWKYDFDYEIRNGGAVITRYTGNGSRVKIPEKLDGVTLTVIEPNAFDGFEGTIIGKKNGLAHQFAQNAGIHFEATEYQLTFVTNCSVNVEPKMVATGSPVELPSYDVLFREGFILSGWYIDNEQIEWLNEGDPMPAEDLTLHAMWVPVVPDLEYDYVKYTDEYGSEAVRITRYLGSASEVTIPTYLDGKVVRSIGAYAFCGTDITAIHINNNVTQVGAFAFKDCKSLTTVTFSSNLTELSKGMFEGCTALGTDSFVEEAMYRSASRLKKIGERAFANTGFARIKIPKTVEYIAPSAFDHCSRLYDIDVDSSNSTYRSFNPSSTSAYGLYSKDGTTLYLYPWSMTWLGVPQTLKTVATGALRSDKLTSLDFSKAQLETIETGAANGCTSLGYITLGKTVKTIADNAFINCPSISPYITLPESLTYIGSDAFSGTMYTSLRIGAKTELAEDAFVIHDGLSITAAIGSPAEAWAKKHGVPFSNINASGFTYENRMGGYDLTVGQSVQVDASELYPSSPVWSSDLPHIASVSQDGTVTGHFEGLALITMEDSGYTYTWLVRVTRASVALEELRMVPSALMIPGGSTKAIRLVQYPANAPQEALTLSWTSSDDSVVSCDNGLLTAKSTGDAVITVTASNGMSASCRVWVCSDLLMLPYELEIIEEEAFAGASFDGVFCPEALREIGSQAFANCESLLFVYIPSQDTAIASNAFSGCSNVKIIAPENSKAIEWAKANNMEWDVP